MAPDSTSPSTVTDAAHPSHDHGKASAALIVGALGVVFGDIGTSPLYALRETFLHDTSLAPTPAHVLGVLSTLFWAVTLTVTIKYVTLIMRADNKGEGGVLALATLASHGLNGGSPRVRHAIITLAVVGLALFYGDAIITPAVSVMGAVEGLSAAAPAFEPFVVPLVLVILVALFLLQARGTADVGRLFG
ncbi:MAG TPA: KUP/HAK/KT family potassium transporter, partial [Reyranella sp.]